MSYVIYILAVTILLLRLHLTQADRRDRRWRHLPDRQYHLISGQDCMLVWVFKLPPDNRNMFMTVTHFTNDREDGMTIASLTVKPSNRNPVQMEIYHDKRTITAEYQTGTVTVTLIKWTPEESGDIYIHIDMPPIPLTALTHITVYGDTRWRFIPDSAYDVIVGHKETFTWQFVPPTKGEFDITIIQDKVTYGMSVATEMIQATDTEPVQLRIYADYRGRVTAKYIPGSQLSPETGTIEMTVLHWTLEDTGEIFTQVDIAPIPLTASSFVSVFEAPVWASDIPEEIRIPASAQKLIKLSRGHSTKSPDVLNVTLEFTVETYVTSKPISHVTIIPSGDGRHMTYSDQSLSGRVYVSLDPRLKDISLQIMNMSQAHVGKFDVIFYFKIPGVFLQKTFHVILEETENLTKHEPLRQKVLMDIQGIPTVVTGTTDSLTRRREFYIPTLMYVVVIGSLITGIIYGLMSKKRKGKGNMQCIGTAVYFQ